MRTSAKIFSISFLLFLGWNYSVAQNNNNANNTGNNNVNTGGGNNNNQAQVTQQAPSANNQQTQPSVLGPGGNPPHDISYMAQDDKARRVVPPAMMREADIMWKERIWRVIDTREKFNQQLYYPESDNANRTSLFSLIKKALLSGEIHAYSFNVNDFDDYATVLTLTDVKASLFSTMKTTTENGNDTTISNEVLANKIRAYMVKEDWHFEKKRSVIDPRILWICPEIQTINKNTGQADPTLGLTPLFWVNFDELRPLMAKTPVFNEKNDAEWRTFDDIFWKRQFISHIIMQSNVFNRSISTYAKGFDALFEGEKIHDNIAGIEHDMWQY
jgi:gliding motility associated protien GldN